MHTVTKQHPKVNKGQGNQSVRTVLLCVTITGVHLWHSCSQNVTKLKQIFKNNILNRYRVDEVEYYALVEDQQGVFTDPWCLCLLSSQGCFLLPCFQCFLAFE